MIGVTGETPTVAKTGVHEIATTTMEPIIHVPDHRYRPRRRRPALALTKATAHTRIRSAWCDRYALARRLERRASDRAWREMLTPEFRAMLLGALERHAIDGNGVRLTGLTWRPEGTVRGASPDTVIVDEALATAPASAPSRPGLVLHEWHTPDLGSAA